MNWKTIKNWCEAKRLAIRQWIAARDTDGKIVAVLWESAAYAAVAAFVLGLFLGAEKFRDIALAMAAILGFPLLFQRTRAASQQAETDSRRRMAEAYSQAAALFAKAELPLRLAGLYALWKIAEEDPENHHIQIMRILCAFVRHPTPLDGWESGDEKYPAQRPDMEAVLVLIGKQRNPEQCEQERKAKYRLNFKGADLRGMELHGANLESADLTEANLESVSISQANLRNAYLSGANLKGASLWRVNLSGVFCLQLFDGRRTNFEGATLNKAILQDALFFAADFHRTDFMSADLRRAVFSNAIFNSRTDFFNAALNGIKFSRVEGIEAIKRGVVLNDENGVVYPTDISSNKEHAEEHADLIANLDVLEVAQWEKRKEEN